MKLFATLFLLLSFSSAFASNGYLDCSYKAHIPVNGPEDIYELRLSASVDRQGNGDIAKRVGNISVLAEIENGSVIRLTLMDQLDTVRTKKMVGPNTFVTVSLANAVGTTADGRAFKGVTLSCQFKTL